MEGQTLGTYVIERELGRGGMGSVWIGAHSLLGRRAAIKVLLPELSKHQDIVQRFFNEARAATAVKHAGIVEIYDFGWAPDGSAYIVMELLDGESLSSRMARQGRLPTAFALGVARQIAAALDAAHKAGVIHRDLKPDNVFLVPDPEVALGERVKLLDFGIAKLTDEQPGNLARTQTGAVMGTPYYMSPEQCRGAGQVDARSDLYALGCMLYEMLGGQVPFPGEGAGEIIGAHLHVAVPPLRALAPDVPAAIEALIMRLLAKRADDRPATGEIVARELTELATGLRATLPAHLAPGPASGTQGAVAREPGPPTTLGGAAAESAHLPVVDDDDVRDGWLDAVPLRRRVGVVVGAGAVLIAGVAVAILLVTGGAGRHERAATPRSRPTRPWSPWPRPTPASSRATAASPPSRPSRPRSCWSAPAARSTPPTGPRRCARRRRRWRPRAWRRRRSSRRRATRNRPVARQVRRGDEAGQAEAEAEAEGRRARRRHRHLTLDARRRCRRGAAART